MPSLKDVLPREILTRVLSIRQPFAEQILLGEKTEEYRTTRAHIRGRVYLYAGKKLAPVDGFPEEEALRNAVNSLYRF